ncbi:MFS transporter [Hoyosella sp. G463]|uniref:MFS transporter n=1 Tax=Lolliginicoccus lacisalsi TaxID=2742202 RepID=A0A927JD25_9ACTN|nr:MFS transporter [Lolliginicoccus lacisalsi]MBD8506893.1 MFS transporter [Lolliginicoccus lacisalsi]
MARTSRPSLRHGALGNPLFRKLLTAQVLALLGTGLLTIALSLLAVDIAGSSAGAVLGTAFTIKMVAYVGIAPVISALAHHVPRKVLLVSADAIRASVALALPLVDAVWQIYLLILVLQAASATFTPAFQAMLPAVLVDEDEYTQGLSCSRVAYDLESLASPVIAIALLAVYSYESLFLGTAVGFLLSGIIVLWSALPTMPIAPSPAPIAARLVHGSRIMLRGRELRALLALDMVVAAATAVVLVTTVIHVQALTRGTGTGVALALACFGTASVLAAVLVPGVLRRRTDRSVMLGGGLLSVIGLATTTVLVAPSTSVAAATAPGIAWLPLVLAWAMMGAGTSMVLTPAARLLRRGSSPASRPAVFAAQFSLSHACFLITYPLAGWLGLAAGQVAATLVLTLLAAAAAVAAAAAWPPSDHAPRDESRGG